MDQLQEARKWIDEGQRIVFFGGAGVSTASGIPDFRSATGLYNKKNDTGHSPEYMLSHEFAVREPKNFQDYVKEELIYEDAEPNGAHKALKILEDEGKLAGVITQNIDSLHQKAGSKKVVEVHGNLRDYYCTKCGKSYDLSYFMEHENPVTCEKCGGMVRPDVTLYGEALDQASFSHAINLVSRADVFIVGGTSLMVYPAAGLLSYYNGDRLILINQERTPLDGRADLVFHEDISKVMMEMVD